MSSTMSDNEAISWIQDNTDYVEAPAGTFLIQEEDLDWPDGPTDAVYLII